MKNIKLLALAGMLMAGTTEARAQQPVMRKAPDAQRDASVTEAQRSQIKAIRERYKGQREQLRTQAKREMEAMKTARRSRDEAGVKNSQSALQRDRDQLRTLNESEAREIRPLLSPEQQEKFDKRVRKMEKHQDKMMRGKHHDDMDDMDNDRDGDHNDKGRGEERRADREGHDRSDWGKGRGEGHGRGDKKP